MHSNNSFPQIFKEQDLSSEIYSEKSNWNGNFLIQDNFLENEDYNYLSSITEKLDLNEFKKNRGVIVIKSTDKAVPKDIRLNMEKIFKKYENNCIEVLNNLNSRKTRLYDDYCITITITPPGLVEKVHIDNYSKLLTGVIYLMPEKNYGTYLYSSKFDKNPLEVNWKRNRVLFFGNKYKESWHSFKSDSDNSQPRYTCLLTLHTNRINAHMLSDLGWFKFIFAFIETKGRENKNKLKRKIVNFLKKLNLK